MRRRGAAAGRRDLEGRAGVAGHGRALVARLSQVRVTAPPAMTTSSLKVTDRAAFDATSVAPSAGELEDDDRGGVTGGARGRRGGRVLGAGPRPRSRRDLLSVSTQRSDRTGSGRIAQIGRRDPLSERRCRRCAVSRRCRRRRRALIARFWTRSSLPLMRATLPAGADMAIVRIASGVGEGERRRSRRCPGRGMTVPGVMRPDRDRALHDVPADAAYWTMDQPPRRRAAGPR